MRKLTAAFAGAGIGALLGLLIGMSVSNTVSVVIGSITSILVILLGMQDKENAQLHAVRVGAFGLTCALCILVGVYIRANDHFSPSVQAQMEQWTKDSLYSKEEAKQYVLYERLGFLSPGTQIDPNKKNNPLDNVLYGKVISQSDCEKLEGYKNFSRAEELDAYRSQGGAWARLAESIAATLPEEQQQKTLHLVKDCFCYEK